MQTDRKQIDKRTTMWNQNRSATLGRPAMKLLGGGGGSTSLRPTLALSCALVSQTDTLLFGLRGIFLALRNIEIRLSLIAGFSRTDAMVM